MRTYFIDGKWIPEAERELREKAKANERDNNRCHWSEKNPNWNDDPYHTNPKSHESW